MGLLLTPLCKSDRGLVCFSGRKLGRVVLLGHMLIKLRSRRTSKASHVRLAQTRHGRQDLLRNVRGERGV